MFIFFMPAQDDKTRGFETRIQYTFPEMLCFEKFFFTPINQFDGNTLNKLVDGTLPVMLCEVHGTSGITYMTCIQ
jgi:hypothetical protein